MITAGQLCKYVTNKLQRSGAAAVGTAAYRAWAPEDFHGGSRGIPNLPLGRFAADASRGNFFVASLRLPIPVTALAANHSGGHKRHWNGISHSLQICSAKILHSPQGHTHTEDLEYCSRPFLIHWKTRNEPAMEKQAKEDHLEAEMTLSRITATSPQATEAPPCKCGTSNHTAP